MTDSLAEAIAEMDARHRSYRRKNLLRRRRVRGILWSIGAQPAAISRASEQILSAIENYEALRSIEDEEESLLGNEIKELEAARKALVKSIRHLRKFRENNAERHHMYSSGMGRDAWRENGRTNDLGYTLIKIDNELRGRTGKRGKRLRNQLWIEFLHVYRWIFNSEATISNLIRPSGSRMIYVSEGRFVAFIQELSKTIENEPIPTGDAIAGVLSKVRAWEAEYGDVWRPQTEEEIREAAAERAAEELRWRTAAEERADALTSLTRKGSK